MCHILPMKRNIEQKIKQRHGGNLHDGSAKGERRKGKWRVRRRNVWDETIEKIEQK